MTLVLTGALLVGSDTPTSIRIDRGLVTQVGADVSVAAGDDVVDLAGRTVMPGFWDAHVHMVQQALVRRRLDVSGAGSAAETAELVAARLRTTPLARGEVLVGYGFRDATWPDAPTLAVLDEAAAGSAVVLVSGDLHCGWFSSAALARFDRVSDATGLVREQDFLPVTGQLDGGDDLVRDGWVREAAVEAARRGVVGVVDLEAADTAAWTRRLEGAQAYPVRVRAGIWPEYLDAALAAGTVTGTPLAAVRDAAGTPLAQVGSLKVVTDGSLNTRTAYCHDAYPGSAERGVLAFGPDVLHDLMARATAHGLTCAIHAIGDAANALALDAFAATGARGSIEHAQLLSWEDVPRFAALGVVASVQPAHLLDDRDVAETIWPGRTDRAYPFAALAEAGVTLALGSDAPVAPLDPLLAVSAAVRRSAAEDGARGPWHGEQRLAVELALASSTDGRGVRPTVGGVADLVVLEGDPLTVGQEGVPLPGVAGTLLAGEWTYRGF